MAGCSSGIRIAHFKNLPNDIVLLSCSSSKSSIVVKSQCSNVKRRMQGLVVVNIMNSEAEPRSSVAVTTITEGVDIDYVEKDAKVMDKSYISVPESEVGGGGGADFIDGSGGNGKFSGGGGGGGGKDNSDDDYEEKEFGPLLKFEEVIRETEARGASLPADMLEAAKTVGLRQVLLLRYLELEVKSLSGDECYLRRSGNLVFLFIGWFYRSWFWNLRLQGSAWPLGFLMRSCAMLRNRMLADPSFLFKIGTEVGKACFLQIPELSFILIRIYVEVVLEVVTAVYIAL